ncbi:MAG: PASTA domain-containing protein [Acidobacteria bacterium]|nr:PASTA domain-containing protein [Acidobacteriota bacterium]
MKNVKPEVVRFTKFGIMILLPIVLAALGVYVGLWIGIRFGQEDVKVPEVTAKDVSDANAILETVGLIPEIRTYRFSADVPENHVIKQTPRAGDQVKSGRKVWLYISAGEKEVAVPRLIGLTEKEAEIVLRQSGLRPGLVSRANVLASAEDEVVQQYPPAGTTNPQSPYVNYLVNIPLESTRFVMPDLKGMSAEDISFFLKKEGFVLRPNEYESTFLRSPGLVITHYPRPGYPITRKSPITLVVSR